jgi:hypothetical protein
MSMLTWTLMRLLTRLYFEKKQLILTWMSLSRYLGQNNEYMKGLLHSSIDKNNILPPQGHSE